MAETEEALRAEVLGVCRNFCLQVWNEALNQAGVEASSILRKAEMVYTTQDLPAEKEVPKRMEIIMAALPLPVKGDLESKDSEASKAASTQPIKAPPKEKIVIKKK